MKKIKKTATITFHKAVNYGAILQTYALQQSILKLGIENEVIDYDCRNITKNFDLISTYSLKSFIKSILIFPLYYRRKKNFESFMKEKICVTRKIDKQVLFSKKFNDSYDLFITGSDQVWNYQLTNLDETYMLDFVKNNKKKISYAASFGLSKIPEQYIEIYRKNLKTFSKILVRENTGVEIINNLINKKAVSVLDPVFLLSKNEWNNIIKNSKFDNIKNKYILVYMPKKEMKIFVEFLSKKYNLPVYNITDFSLKRGKFFGNIEFSLGPEDFISAIKNARFVVTASFHAVVFSIIYNKEFYIYIPQNGENGIKRASRLNDLLKILEIKNREINSKFVDDNNSLEWKKINEKLEMERQYSLKILKEVLEVE